jgi:hypothetical protein
VSTEWIAVVAALGGAIAGAIVAGGLALWLDRLNWLRRTRTRWDEVRRSAYAAFLHAVNDVSWHAHVAPMAFKAALERDGPEEAHEALADLRRSEALMWRHFAEIEIVAGQEVVDAARHVANRVRDIATTEGAAINNPSEETLKRQEEAHAAFAAAHDHFKTVVRREMLVSS